MKGIIMNLLGKTWENINISLKQAIFKKSIKMLNIKEVKMCVIGYIKIENFSYPKNPLREWPNNPAEW